MQIEGKVIVLGEVQQPSEKFKKKAIVIETPGDYPQKIQVDFANDKIAMLDKITIGDDVKVSINIKGNEYNGKYYVNLQGFKIEQNF